MEEEADHLGREEEEARWQRKPRGQCKIVKSV